MLFSELGLSEPVLKAVEKCGYEHPTPIQEQAIPIILEGRDLIGASQTGTGKTAAFALPLLTRIRPIGKPQILVLEPTRELADQVAESFAEYGEFTGLKVALLYGGVGYGKQTEDLKKGADIVVATPGRWWTTSTVAPCASEKSRPWFWMKWTECWTWGSCPLSVKSSTFVRGKEGKPSSSPPPCLRSSRDLPMVPDGPCGSYHRPA